MTCPTCEGAGYRVTGYAPDHPLDSGPPAEYTQPCYDCGDGTISWTDWAWLAVREIRTWQRDRAARIERWLNRRYVRQFGRTRRIEL